MVKINSTAFGSITIDDKVYEDDVIIKVDGTIVPRAAPESHSITKEQVARALEGSPKTIVIGTGQSGIAQLDNEARELIAKKGVQLIATPTPQAIKKYNEAAKPKAGLFHLTC